MSDKNKIDIILTLSGHNIDDTNRRRSFRGDLLCRDDLLFRKCGARKRWETGSRTVYEHPRSRNFVVSPKISETRLHRETGSFETGPL